ncbi:MAG: aminopeptidase [Bacteroidetes bacterium]|nr:MAG: aminopeptidase [Bacteroidota bacterium]
MRKIIMMVLLSTLMMSHAWSQEKTENKEEKGYQFTAIKDVPHSSIKNQYRSGTCWSFSGIAFFEAEMMKKGKPETDLSEMFVVWHSYFDKTIKYVRMHGTINYGGGGAFNDVMDVIRKYGITPDTVYSGLQYAEPKHVHAELDDLLLSMVKSIIKDKNRKLTPVWPMAIAGVLNAYLGEIPENFKYEGKDYTPRSFADDYCELNMDDYIMMTSYSHHPFYKPFALEVQDNWAWGMVYNVPLDEMMQTINNAIDNDYTVAWAADVSEKGFSWKNGVAIVPENEVKSMNNLEQAKWEKLSAAEKSKALYSFDGPRTEKKITQEVRQLAFDNYQTTDDHGMLLVGTAKDQAGNHYFKVKNSWGTDQKYDGYFYASDAFVAYKTMSIMINKNAIPKAIRKKLNI